jgi:RNA polymerase subunit RPABC4/transcription elongation factor Spt4
MSLAIFGISNSGLNLAVRLFILMMVVLWLALIVYTYTDARRRISDPFLVACATVASFFPFIGTAVYAIVRPPEFLEDAHERELEIKAAELRVRHLAEQSCPNCEFPVEKNYLRCPNCQRRLKDPCPSCSKPVDPRWELCPYCETALASRGRRPQSSERRPERREEPPRREPRKAAPKRQPAAGKKASPGSSKKSSAGTSRKDPAGDGAKEASPAKPQQRSPSREPDPDPRQA